jgi:hypothetical protein
MTGMIGISNVLGDDRDGIGSFGVDQTSEAL